MDFTKQSPSTLNFCPGMRGLERGFERACTRLGWLSPITAAYVEIEAFINYNLVKQMEQGVLDPAPIWTDLKTFDPRPFRNKIDGIFAGYPCQPFSLAGERRGEDDPRHLYPFISRSVEAIGPLFCFFENVRGHLSLGYGEVYKDLRRLGYAVESGIFTAEEVGAPHQRERLFILAIRRDMVNAAVDGNRRDLRELSRKNEIITGPEEQHENERRKSFNAGTAFGVDLVNSECSDEGRETETGESAEFIETSSRSEEERRELDELAHAHAHGHLLRESELDTTEGREHALGDITSGDTERMANSKVTGSHGYDTKGGLSTRGRDSQYDKFPARPGEQQYSWEEPRTIKSGVGITINGYNFREDLLRMAGNAVVEQTAEIAFLTLLEKHYKNN